MSTICPAVWDHLCINTAGKNRLCCNAVTQENDWFLENYDAHWTDFRNTIKEQMLAGAKPDACKSCWQKEAIGITSLREQFIQNYQIRNQSLDFSNRDFPLELDLKLGNYCNLSCRMCSSFSSSTYAKEFKTIYKDTGVDYGVDAYEKDYVQNKWYNDPRFVTAIKDMIDNGLRQLKFTGGEPLMVPAVRTLLEYCIETNKSNNIDLVLITNGTLLDSNWINILNQFKHVSLIFSIDGVEDTFEYIRHPAKWTQIQTAFDILKHTNYYKAIAFTFQALNVLDTVNILKLAREHNFCIDLISLDTPGYLDVQYIPTALKQEALSLIENFLPSSNEEKFCSNVRNKLLYSEYNKAYSTKLVEMSKLKDRYKQQDFNKLEVAKYYDNI
jgi:sulfatase maturation enzyme AslB (radical SAM superfamily)